MVQFGHRNAKCSSELAPTLAAAKAAATTPAKGLKKTATIPSFKEQLAAVNGKIRHVNMWNQFDRFHDGLLYYVNKAERLRDSARLLWDTSLQHSDAAMMLAGSSIELLLKGTILGLQECFPHCHRLECLIATAGISISDKDHVTSQLLTEYIVWAARYPTPRKWDDWFLEETGGWPLSRAPYRHRTDDRDDYESLWKTLVPYFGRVNEATFESAELNENDIYKLKTRPHLKHQCASRRV